jgi:hypothetical protein
VKTETPAEGNGGRRDCNERRAGGATVAAPYEDVKLATNDHGKFLSWSEQPERRRLIGTFRGFREGKFGLLATFDTDAGPVVTPAPTVLAQELGDIEVGRRVLVEHLGLRPSKKNPERSYRAFSVTVIEPGAPAPPTPVAADADNVPF